MQIETGARREEQKFLVSIQKRMEAFTTICLRKLVMYVSKRVLKSLHLEGCACTSVHVQCIFEKGQMKIGWGIGQDINHIYMLLRITNTEKLTNNFALRS